nr:uncharacterized protein LOC111512461 [Leptinotarsa decemlineata]
MSGKKGKDVPNNYQMLKTSWSVQGKLFFEHSTLHGVRYIAENGRPFIERFMWFACVAVGTIATTVIIFNLWEKFQTNPTITGLDTDFHNWDVSFPGITVCQVIPTSNEKIEEYIQEHYQRNGSSAELDFFTDLSRLSLYSFPYFTEKYLSQTYIDSKTNLKELIFNVSSD